MIFGKSGWLKGYENGEIELQFQYFLPHEFKLLDSHQRLSFEVAYETFEDVSITLPEMNGSKQKYILSYFYNLLGPSFIIDTTCSSTLFSLNCACQRIRNGECRSALCDGQCKAFGASANGYVRSEGSGMILLQQLSNAERNENRILVVIRGTATYSNGLMEQLLASLSGELQVWLFDRVLCQSNVFPSEENYIQAHDTGTLVSDPVECKSIRRNLNVGRQRGRPIIVGSVKSNVGHLEPAAGIVSQIKVAYALKHNLIPPTISAHTLYPRIDMKALNLKNVIQIQSLPAAANKNQLRTGTVSAFEFRETNVSLIVFKAKVRLVNVLRFQLYLDGVLKHLY
ncbi:MAG: putative hybrid non-ribosomal peptide synthetase/type I polyketide synthase [Streblomastix strix]|uniref:Putative hybrid non-ribosomal peptide synthetase/type I polyketide synthase n=1 Tax=Streblomastix strix TaxID=222440 RepID=A0A5J4WTM3_9EUKA|nr:MAG: putative hybrid non-ribosomal peptide synthetase/type I polyketide synthase [Streblomastix strix]